MLYSISDAETACVIPALISKATFDYIGRLRDGCLYPARADKALCCPHAGNTPKGGDTHYTSRVVLDRINRLGVYPDR